jgi:hypothetical protein
MNSKNRHILTLSEKIQNLSICHYYKEERRAYSEMANENECQPKKKFLRQKV